MHLDPARSSGNDAAHAYNFSGPATLNRAGELGGHIARPSTATTA
jgi:hypothetical protein